MDTPPKPETRPITGRQLTWLRGELADWQSAGIIDDPQATRIAGRYREEADPGVRFSLGRILLALGGGFVGIGLIWLVAANLDELSPIIRLAVVAVLWLGFLLGGEHLASRHASRAVVGAVRLMAALGFGALVFQAAQSLQVPAFEPRLMGVWAAGALLHGYVSRAFMPFLVGVAASLFWWVAQPLWDEASAITVVLTLGAGAVLAASLAALHDGRLDRFAWLWRLLGAGLALAALFVAAIPGIGSDGLSWSVWLILELGAAAVAAVAAVATRPIRDSIEPLGAIVVLGGSLLLAVWDTGNDAGDITANDWAHAATSVTAYVLVAVAVVALGTVRDHGALAWLALAGLVVFTTFQSFAVFAPIVTGAWLFVVLGTVFLGTGFLFDRARRGLTQVLDTDSTEGAPR